MTFKEAFEKRKEYEYLINTPFSELGADGKGRIPPITHIVVAPNVNPSPMMTNQIENRLTAEQAVLINGANDDFNVFIIYYDHWSNDTLYWRLDKYLAAKSGNQHQ